MIFLLHVVLSLHWILNDQTLAADSCSAGSNDAGASLIQQLYRTIGEAECKLVSDTLYKQYDPTYGEEVDFIVVGAGSAGAVVANRLSENKNWTVLLLEAGSDPTVTSEIPGLITANFQSKLDWTYKTEPESSYCLSSLNQSCYWPRGKVLGGSSTINAMMYIRGNPKDYDAWSAAGNTGWSYKDVLQYFKRSEDVNGYEILSNSDYKKFHGTGGYLKINSWPSHIFTEYLSSIFADRRYKTFNDVNGKDNAGFFQIQGTVSEGQRYSTAKAFIKSIENRSNLKVSKYSLVTKLLIHKNNKTVFGVEFLNKQGQLVRIKSNKEVVLSGGTINSPQILMLSGIGPKEHLQDLGIDLIQDLQVGRNLQDHLLMAGIVYTVNISLPTPSAVDEMYKYLSNFSGSLSSNGLSGNAAFINACSRNYPDIEVLFAAINVNNTAALKANFRSIQMNEEVTNAMLDILSRGTMLQFLPILLRPKSVGKILLKSTNPLDYPKIYAGYLSNQKDIEVFLQGIRFLTNLGNTKTMKSLNAKLEKVKISSCESFEYNSDAYWVCVLRHLGRTVYHPVGTCKMGPKWDKSAVVDPQLKVYNVKNLRVVDASIIPTHVSGHTHAAAVMIGEKGSDMIKESWM